MPDQTVRIVQAYCKHCNLATPKNNTRCIHCGRPFLPVAAPTQNVKGQSQRLAS